ncbi:MAG: L-asparaginase 1, partial [Prevotella sp.]|nr:L-asparaginase 1 [Prevotella sp.]
GEDATVEATVTKLMVLQGTYSDQQKVKAAMQKPLAGEFTRI